MATLVALIAVGALVVVLGSRESRKPELVAPVVTVSAGPQLSGAPPTEVTLTDLGTAIEVSWRDPTGGKAPFMVTMARKGQQLKVMSQVGLGTTQTTVAGLNPALQYCFAVVTVYAFDRYASSNQVCTKRK